MTAAREIAEAIADEDLLSDDLALAIESALLAERRRAIEEAAQLADKMQQAAAAVLADGHDDDAAAQHDTAMEIAQAIRSLASPRAEEIGAPDVHPVSPDRK